MFEKNLNSATGFFVRGLIKGLTFIWMLFFPLMYLSGYFSQDTSSNVKPVSEAVSLANVKIAEIASFPTGVQGMTINDEGVIYFSDTYSRLDEVSRVYALSPPYSGEPVPTEITGQSIAGLLWHNEKLYVSFLNKDEVIIYDRELQFLESRFVDSPWGFATDGEYVFVCTYYGDIGLITNTRVKMFVEKIGYPFDMVFSGKESLWISQKATTDTIGNILEIGFGGEILRELNTGILNPCGLEVDENGSLYIADKDGGAIYRIPEAGMPELITKDYASPVCIIWDQLGRLIVNSDHEGGRLLIIKIPL